jgi:hypothetical protein
VELEEEEEEEEEETVKDRIAFFPIVVRQRLVNT